LIAARRFPPPWSVEEEPACFVVRDHNGQALAYVYFEEEPGRRLAAKLLSKGEAWRWRPEYGEAALEIEFVVHAN
jgi:endonuclease YncB( thermonuclease family)